MAAFKAVKKHDLPNEWRNEAPKKTLDAFAKMLDCDPKEIQSHTLWTLPECVLALKYQAFLMKNNDPEQVGLMIENYETWTKSYGGESQVAKDRVIQEMLETSKPPAARHTSAAASGRDPERSKTRTAQSKPPSQGRSQRAQKTKTTP